jgi:hypothetical protein
MNAYFQLFAAALTCVVISLAVLRVLSSPLTHALRRICPDEDAAAFWLSYTKVMLVLAPLLLVVAVDLFGQFGDPLVSLRLSLMATLGGLLIGLHSIGKRLGQFIKVPTAESRA